MQDKLGQHLSQVGQVHSDTNSPTVTSRTDAGHTQSQAGLPKHTTKAQSEHNNRTMGFEMSSELKQLVDCWDKLPKHIKATITTLIKSVRMYED